MSKRRYTPDVLAVGAAAFVGSMATQKILLTPKHKVKITDKIEVPVQGLIPFSQKYLAKLSKVALNNMLPLTVSGVSSALEFVHTKDRIREFILWFVYDFLSRYSLNTFMSNVLSKFDFYDKDKYKDVLRDAIQRLLTEKADRDMIIQTITAEVVSIMRLLTEGTLAAMIFNDRFAAAASVTIATAVDKFLQNDAAAKFTDFLFRLAGQFEDITISNILTNVLRIDRHQMGQKINGIYDAILGDKMVETLRDLKLGDVAYEMVSGVDYNALYDYIKLHMSDDLMRLNFTGATAAMYFFAGSKNIVLKAQKKSNDKADKKVRKAERQAKRLARKAEKETLANADA